MNYSTTKDQQTKFMEWAVNYLIENLGISRKLAEIEVSWFILTWGIKVTDGKSIEKTI